MIKKMTSKYNNYYSCVFAEASPGFSYFCFGIQWLANFLLSAEFYIKSI
jgi:hypothetical protein